MTATTKTLRSRRTSYWRGPYRIPSIEVDLPVVARFLGHEYRGSDADDRALVDALTAKYPTVRWLTSLPVIFLQAGVWGVRQALAA